MTRIVSGAAGGRLLRVPSDGTRPTSDRVREALFSTLAGLVELTGARVLDLFAGTGAVGLEAASRGAAHVTLVDSGRDAATALRHNAGVVGRADIVIRQQSVDSFLAVPASSGSRSADAFDLVFADPPYAYPEPALAATLGRLADGSRWLSPRAVVVVERSSRSDPPPWPVAIQPIKNRRYGDSVLWYGQRD